MLQKSKIISIVFWVLVIACILISWHLRAGLPAKDLIVGTECKLSDVDAYHHLWLADYTFENYPNVQRFTYMLTFPEGQEVGQRPLNSFMIATVAKLTSQTTDLVALYFPAVTGILSLIPALFIGWIVWNRWAGLIAVAILSVIPGEYYGRLALGVSDQHAVEVVLMMFFILFYVLALRKHMVWSFLAGVFLSAYIMNWAGAPILVLCVLIFITIQSIKNQFKLIADNRVLFLTSFIPLLMGFFTFAIFRPNEIMYMLFYGGASIAPLIIYMVSKYTVKLKPYWYPIILFVVVMSALGVMHLFQPVMTKYAFLELYGLLGAVGAEADSLGRTISEVQPIIFPYGHFTLDIIWGVFGISFFTGLAGMIIHLWNLKRPEYLYMVIWAFYLFLITLMQRRYGYYSAVSLCLFTGYFCTWIVNKVGWKEHTKKEIKRGSPERTLNSVIVALAVVIILPSLVIPNFYLTSKEARNHPYMQSQSWQDALTYLRTQTSKSGDYGVLSWWDYGYWIVRDGQRPVPCHPGGGSVDKSAKFFTSFSTEEANSYIVPLRCDYVVIDYQMAKFKFYAMPLLAGKKNFNQSQYNDCMLARLYYSENGIEGYQEVFESNQKFEGQSQVKIYKRYDIVRSCDCGK